MDCHVGTGATNFAESKLSGVRQLVRLLTGSHATPIPAPVRTMRPARDTCEQCHWPEKFHGDKIRVFREFGDDEESTESVTTLRVHVGGGSEALGVATGIHWHMNVGNVVEYIATDPKRQTIPYVRLEDREGNVREFVAPGVTAEALTGGERRRMDCMDCHNRPAHIFSATPERAVDLALAIGRVDRTLPYIRRAMVEALRVDVLEGETGPTGVGRQLVAFYRAEYPEVAAERAEAIERAVAVTDAIQAENVFPEMKIDWGTYPNDLGHTDSSGCFRCHDDEHRAADGSVIRQDCEICHDFE